MTATTVPTNQNYTDTRPIVWRTGTAAALTAAAATTTVALTAHALGVNFETAPGDAIPLAGFAQLTVVFSAIGVLLARAIGHRAVAPRSTFIRTTIVLTAVSLLPDVLFPFDVTSKCVLMLTHLVAASIVIPALASRLEETSR
jgi:hypothetical protein